jgi:IS5 family transposase
VVGKRVLTILNARKDTTRKASYRALLIYARRVVGYAVPAAVKITSFHGNNHHDYFRAMNVAEMLERAIGILRRVIDQTDRRVFKGEKVPASEKVVSFFEDQTNIIVKGRRDTQYGHKVFLSGGASMMIFDCMIERGNPADSDRYRSMLDRHADCLGHMPRQVAADGGFASRDNLSDDKENQVKDAVFAKKHGLTVMETAKSAWGYKMLHNFRAGMEARISTLKRAFGLDRCTWSGWEGFQRSVWSSIASCNLLAMDRIKLAKA